VTAIFVDELALELEAKASYIIEPKSERTTISGREAWKLEEQLTGFWFFYGHLSSLVFWKQVGLIS
jgi:hypothetical protein